MENIGKKIDEFDEWVYHNRYNKKTTWKREDNSFVVKWWKTVDNVMRKYLTTEELYELFLEVNSLKT